MHSLIRVVGLYGDCKLMPVMRPPCAHTTTIAYCSICRFERTLAMAPAGLLCTVSSARWPRGELTQFTGYAIRPPAAHDDHASRGSLPARPDRLWRASTACALAGRCAHRGADRPQLRGRGRKLRSPRRRGIGDVSLGDHRCAAVCDAPPEHRVALRVRLARRAVAIAAPVPRAEDPGDNLRPGDGARAQPRRSGCHG